MAIPPIGLAYVAAALERAQHHVALIDGVGDYADQNYRKAFGVRWFEVNGAHVNQIVAGVDVNTRLIGVTCMFMHHWPLVREILHALRARFPSVVIVLGGEHASGNFESVLLETSVDCVVLGEGEETIVEFANAVEKGLSITNVAGTAWREGNQVHKGAIRARIVDIDTIAPPAWHLVPVKAYASRKLFSGPSLGTSMPIMATRGCPYQCTFCTSPQMWTTKWIARTPKYVVDEIGDYRIRFGANDFQFVDLTAIIKRDWILAFCRELRSRNWPDVKWQLPSGTRSEAIDYEVGLELVASGCSILTYAPESGSVAQLRRIKKKVKIDRMLESIRDVRRAGVSVECFMILGFPDEEIIDVLKTYVLIFRFAIIGVESVILSGYRPAPGTESTELLVRTGTIEWNDDLCMDVIESNSLIGGRSFSPIFSNGQIWLLRFFGYGLFFFVSFLCRPWRPFKIAYNLLREKQTSKLEKSLTEIMRKLRTPKS